MRVNPKTVQRRVRLLKDPNPNYVSIVTHGANQTPFSVVKRDQPPKGKQAKGAANMALRPVNLQKTLARPAKPVSRAKKDGVQPSAPEAGSSQVLKLEFDQEDFKDEAAVKTWLDNNGWTDYDIRDESDDGLYVVKSSTVSRGDLTDIQEVMIENGLAGYVGKLKATSVEKVGKGNTSGSENSGNGSVKNKPEKDKGKGKNGGTTAKSDDNEDDDQESIIKLDWWEMYQSRGESVAEVLKDGMSDGMPPGMDSVMSATMYAVKNVLIGSGDVAEKTAKLASVGAEMATIMGTVYDLYEGANGLTRKQHSDETRDFVEAFEAQLSDNEEPDEVDVVTEVAAKAGNGDNEDDDKNDKNKPAPKDKAKKGAGPEGEQLTPQALVAAFATAMAPMQKQMQNMGRALELQSKATKAAEAAAAEATRKAEEYGNRAPAKKGHENDPDEEAPRQSELDGSIVDNLHSFMGVMRKSNPRANH